MTSVMIAASDATRKIEAIKMRLQTPQTSADIEAGRAALDDLFAFLDELGANAPRGEVLRSESPTALTSVADLSALFAPPTPEESARRLTALEELGRHVPDRRAEVGLGPLNLSPQADPYGYEEQANRQMGEPQR